MLITVKGILEAVEHNLKGAHMAKHITKSVIEDIAYTLKNSGLWLEDSKVNPPEDHDLNYSDPNVLLDDLIEQLAEVMAEHDPGFDRLKWNRQTEYRVQQ